MQIPRNMMDVYFGYNFRVGDVKGAKEGIVEFQQLANSASSPEERARYAQAVKQLKNEILPKMQQEMQQLGKQLGLKKSQIGKVVKADMDDMAHLALKKPKRNQQALSFITDYETGSYYSHKT